MITNLRSDYVYRGPDIPGVSSILVQAGQIFPDYVAFRNINVKIAENARMVEHPNEMRGFDLVGESENPTLGYGMDFAALDEGKMGSECVSR